MKRNGLIGIAVALICLSIVSASPVQASGMVNINTASKRRLQSLPGVGAGIAKKIVMYRRSIGSFGSVSELGNVPGVGEKTVRSVKGYATVGALSKRKRL